MTSPLRVNRWSSAVRVLGIVFVVAGLLAVSVVDADGDPTTANVATVVLGGDVLVVADTTAHHSPSEPSVPSRSNRLTPLRRAVGRWIGEGRRRWMARIRPIRGP